MDVFAAIHLEKYFYRLFGISFYTHVKGKGLQCSLLDTFLSFLMTAGFLIILWGISVLKNETANDRDEMITAAQSGFISTILYVALLGNACEVVCFSFLVITLFIQRHRTVGMVNYFHQIDQRLALICDVGEMNTKSRKISLLSIFGFVCISALAIYLYSDTRGSAIKVFGNFVDTYKSVMNNCFGLYFFNQIRMLSLRVEILRTYVLKSQLNPTKGLFKFICRSSIQFRNAAKYLIDTFSVVFLILSFRLFVTFTGFLYAVIFISTHGYLKAYYYLILMSVTLLLVMGVSFCLTAIYLERIERGLLDVQKIAASYLTEIEGGKLLLLRLHCTQKYQFTALGMFNIDINLLYSVSNISKCFKSLDYCTSLL